MYYYTFNSLSLSLFYILTLLPLNTVWCAETRAEEKGAIFILSIPQLVVCIRLGGFLRVIFRVLLIKRTMCRRIKEPFIRQSIHYTTKAHICVCQTLAITSLDVLPRNHMTHSFDISGTTEIPRKSRAHRRTPVQNVVLPLEESC